MSSDKVRTFQEIKAGIEAARAALAKGPEAVAKYLMDTGAERVAKRARRVREMRGREGEVPE